MNTEGQQPWSRGLAAALQWLVLQSSPAAAPLLCINTPLLHQGNTSARAPSAAPSPIAPPSAMGGWVGGWVGVGYRLSAYASIPCYLCVAVALTVSKALT
jgi:hypothetical protein